jgi:ESS family glutamate:Na+ symporter
LLLISRWLLPSEHWFQLGLINYGMSTGTTATGFVLLRMIDPELDSGAAEDYALAAPLSAPFIGGGMITIALPLLVLERINIAIPALVIAGIVSAMIFVGRRLFFRAQQPS